MGLEILDYISKRKDSSENMNLPDRINLHDLAYYHARSLPEKFSRDKFLESITSTLPCCTHGFIWHHAPFGGIHPNFGKYVVILKDRYVEVLSEQDKGGEHLIDLIHNLAKRSLT